jgi:hypothetical protein
MRRLLSAASALALAGCVTPINDNYPWRLDGAPVQALIDVYGPPDSVEETADGGVRLTYTVFTARLNRSEYVMRDRCFPAERRRGACFADEATRFYADGVRETECTMTVDADAAGVITQIDGARGSCVQMDDYLRARLEDAQR